VLEVPDRALFNALSDKYKVLWLTSGIQQKESCNSHMIGRKLNRRDRHVG
jgi:hypothetical protein